MADNINLIEWVANRNKKAFNAHGFIVIGKMFDANSAIQGNLDMESFFDMVDRAPNSQEEFDMWCELDCHGKNMYADIMSRP